MHWQLVVPLLRNADDDSYATLVLGNNKNRNSAHPDCTQDNEVKSKVAEKIDM